MMCSSKRKSVMPSCGEAAKITAEASQSNKRKKAIVPLCALLLPDDMMLEVLLRLPVKSILRFQVVSRAWAALLSSKDFCSLHMATSKVLPPVFANGFLHWLINPSLIIRRPRAAIISFSVAEETFGCIRSPPFWGPREHLRSWSQSEGEHLVVMDDQLYIVRDLRNRILHGSTLEIWGLLDYSSGDWSLNHRIDLFGHVKRELGEPQVVRVIGSVGNTTLGKKIVIATSEHWVHEKFRKKVYTYDPRCQVLEVILSVTEAHPLITYLIPGSRFSLCEESPAPVHKSDDKLACHTLAKLTKETTTTS